jgi:ribosomal protein S18 acetylase RimI-like enzyme
MTRDVTTTMTFYPGTVAGLLPRRSMAGIAVRDATIADSDRIAQLVSDLGYPTSSSQMSMRLESVLRDRDYHTLVACDGDRIVGFIGTRIGPQYESDHLYGQIMALAVGRDRQRSGVGRTLVQAAESILTRDGARVFVVTSGNHRSDAHAFYEKNGYTFTGRRYTKPVALLA